MRQSPGPVCAITILVGPIGGWEGGGGGGQSLES